MTPLLFFLDHLDRLNLGTSKLREKRPSDGSNFLNNFQVFLFFLFFLNFDRENSYVLYHSSKIFGMYNVL